MAFPFWAAEGSLCGWESPSRAHHHWWRRQFVVPLGFQVRLICGLRGTNKKNDLDLGAPTSTLPLLAPIFILRCGRPGHVWL